MSKEELIHIITRLLYPDNLSIVGELGRNDIERLVTAVRREWVLSRPKRHEYLRRLRKSNYGLRDAVIAPASPELRILLTRVWSP